MKIVYLGNPRFSAILLEKLCQSKYKPSLVITNPDKPVGRKKVLTPPPVKEIARKFQIPSFQSDDIKEILSKLKNLNNIDLIITVAYGKILPKEILDIPKRKCINLHPSLLPRWRGPSPIQYTILNGDKKTGVTIIKITESVDAGPILAQRELQDFTGREDYLTLEKKLAKLGGKLLIETIPKWMEGKIEPLLQDEKEATFSKILKKEDGKIDWQKTAEEIERKVRAFNPWPGTFTFWEVLKDTPQRVIVLKTRVYKFPTKVKYPLGKVLVVPQNEIGVQCKKDFLVIQKLKLEGEKELAAEEFLRGHPDFIGTILK